MERPCPETLSVVIERAKNPFLKRLRQDNPEEIACLCEHFLQAPEPIRKDWASRLTDTSLHNVVSAWFEMMLFGFLRDRGHVEFLGAEPSRSQPDFLFRCRGKNAPVLAIEAYVPHDSPEQAREAQFKSEVWQRVRQHLLKTWGVLPLSATVHIERLTPKTANQIPGRVYKRLWRQIDEFVGKLLEKKKANYPGCVHTFTFVSEDVVVSIDFQISPTGTKPHVIPQAIRIWQDYKKVGDKIRQKIRQHRHLFRGKSSPADALVIATFPGYFHHFFTADDAIDALYGQEVIQYDPEQDEARVIGRDPSGLFCNEIPHLSGILVFHKTDRHPFLDGVFLPNPHAKFPVPAGECWGLPEVKP